MAVHLRVITPDVHLLYNKQNFYKLDFLKFLYLDGGLFDDNEQIRFEIWQDLNFDNSPKMSLSEFIDKDGIPADYYMHL